MPDNALKFFPTFTTIGENAVTLLEEMRRDPFLYPFYNDGVHMSRKENYQRKEMSVSALPELENPLEIKGFIFHTSHCGSTLLARMMMALPEVRVVSETEAINGLFLSYLYHELPREQVLAHLKTIIEYFRQPLEQEKSLVFKTTSWNIFFIDFFQELYPDVPWIYIDRDTEKAVDSSLNDGGGFVQWWDFPTDIPMKYFLAADYKLSDKRSYVRSIIERQREHAGLSKKGAYKFFHYPNFIDQFSSEILPHFKLDFPDKVIEAAVQMTSYKSKSFEPKVFQKKLDR